jgi:hypothetical protein
LLFYLFVPGNGTDSEKLDSGTVLPINLNGTNNNVFPAHPKTFNLVPYILLKDLNTCEISIGAFFQCPTVIYA